MTEEQVNYIVDTYYEKENKFSRDGYYRLVFTKNEDNKKLRILSKRDLDKFIETIDNMVTSKELSNNPAFTIQI